MERLTHTNKGMAWYKSDLLLLEPCEMSHAQISEVLHRLAAYEDTGLTPDQIIAMTGFKAFLANVTLTDAEMEELRQMLLQHTGTIMVCGEDKADICVCCGEIVPEGRQVCPTCEKEAGL